MEDPPIVISTLPDYTTSCWESFSKGKETTVNKARVCKSEINSYFINSGLNQHCALKAFLHNVKLRIY